MTNLKKIILWNKFSEKIKLSKKEKNEILFYPNNENNLKIQIMKENIK